MPNPIEQAREALQQGLSQLPANGLRTDYALELRRYPDDAGDDLNMDPEAPATRGEPDRLVVAAPDVKPVSLAYQAVAGGLVQAGDLLVKLVRTAEVEAFLKARVDDPAGTTGGPYPELSRVEFWINGEPHRAIHARPKGLTVTFTVRRQAATA